MENFISVFWHDMEFMMLLVLHSDFSFTLYFETLSKERKVDLQGECALQWLSPIGSTSGVGLDQLKPDLWPAPSELDLGSIFSPVHCVPNFLA